MRSRLQPRVRKEAILIAAIKVARRPGGWGKLTRAGIAKEANCADGLVSRYLGSMEAIKRALMRHAIKHEMFDLVAQGLAAGDPIAKNATRQLKHRAFAFMIEDLES